MYNTLRLKLRPTNSRSRCKNRKFYGEFFQFQENFDREPFTDGVYWSITTENLLHLRQYANLTPAFATDDVFVELQWAAR